MAYELDFLGRFELAKFWGQDIATINALDAVDLEILRRGRKLNQDLELAAFKSARKK